MDALRQQAGRPVSWSVGWSVVANTTILIYAEEARCNLSRGKGGSRGGMHPDLKGKRQDEPIWCLGKAARPAVDAVGSTHLYSCAHGSSMAAGSTATTGCGPTSRCPRCSSISSISMSSISTSSTSSSRASQFVLHLRRSIGFALLPPASRPAARHGPRCQFCTQPRQGIAMPSSLPRHVMPSASSAH